MAGSGKLAPREVETAQPSHFPVAKPASLGSAQTVGLQTRETTGGDTARPGRSEIATRRSDGLTHRIDERGALLREEECHWYNASQLAMYGLAFLVWLLATRIF